MRYRARNPRPGAVAVEAAIVYPVLIFLLLGAVVGGIGVFRYQQTAGLSREASRRISVRGVDWRRETGSDPMTEEQLRSEVVLPLAVGMDADDLSIQTWLVNPVSGTVTPWDESNHAPTSLTGSGEPVSNRVRVQIRYRWRPGVFGISWTFTSVSEIPMSF